MLINCFHGTTLSAFHNMRKNGIIFSRPADTRPRWLGHGLYFFEDAPSHAKSWALERSARKSLENEFDPPVLAQAHINAAELIDFVDTEFHPLFKRFVEKYPACPKRQLGPDALFRTLSDEEKKELYFNHEDHHYVTGFLLELRKFHDYAGIRACFMEGKQIYDRSWFLDRSHIQVCLKKIDIISNTRWYSFSDNRWKFSEELTNLSPF